MFCLGWMKNKPSNLDEDKRSFCIAFQLINKDRKPVDLFCRILDQEKIPFKVSDRMKRNLPRIEMP